MTSDPGITRSEAAENFLDARRHFGPDSTEAAEAAEELDQVLTLPEVS
jgi:hypothetical protein